MKLYGSFTSPFVRHVRIVILETGLPCEFIETDQNSSAEKSPTKRVPFFEDGDIFLTDSSSIVKYLREKVGQHFCKTAKELDEYCLVNTLLEATTNLFFIKRDGVDIQPVPYLQRQAARIASILTDINQLPFPSSPPYSDMQLRLACYIGWSKLRNQVDFSNYSHLENFYSNLQEYPPFKATLPPQS
ncbi:MAG TPA: glutathione S-transferase [Cellvibrio sp.]|nr:glutathione S-transferase [Cellvibrio sp.]